MSAAVASATTKVGRNDPCPCGSGRKFKHCCEGKMERAEPPPQASPRVSPSPALKQRLRALFLVAEEHANAGRLAEAMSLFKEIVQLDPQSSQAHHALGMFWLRCGRPAEAVAILQRALELRPGSDPALRGFVDRLQAETPTPDALRACRKLSRTADSALKRRYYLAKALALEGKPDEAERELQRLLAASTPLMPSLQVAAARQLLAQLLSARGMFEEAARHLTQAVESQPIAFQQLTAVKRMTAADRPLIDRVRRLVEAPELDVAPRIHIHFGLGKAFDDLGEYEEAIRHYEAANGLRANSTRLNRAEVATWFDTIIKSFTAEAFMRARQNLTRAVSPDDDLPVFIVGMPRCGSTLLEQTLSSHPAVAGGGELTFWLERFGGWNGSKLDSLEAGQLTKFAENYHAELRRIGPGALRVIDKELANYQILGLLRLALPEARIIHCRRDPLDTCLSIFFADFETRHDYAWDRGDLAFYFRQYERLMEHWRRVLPADRFIELEYERLIADREAESRRLVAFCGLDWNDSCLAPERNERSVKTTSLWQARQPVYATSVERWRRYEPWLGELRELLPAAEATKS
jgi:tetratricopeptide (TPR) repeat protein